LALGPKITGEELHKILDVRPRIEKVAIKDAKLRTFITQDSSRDDLVAHVYDISYGSVEKGDNLVIIDDSIVRGTTLKKSILLILDRLSPKKIIVVSSAPQIRYPDCYGIDMAKIEDFVAFRAAMSLVDDIYKKCIKQLETADIDVVNYVKEFYAPFSQEEISKKIGELLSSEAINWYFTGDYPTAGGNRVVNKAFINFYEGKNERAY